MIEWLSQPWPWFVAGPLIALVMLLLLWLGGGFGVSSNFRTICSMAGAGKNCDFFRFDWKFHIWNLVFVLGAMIGGGIACTFLEGDKGPLLSQSTTDNLISLGFDMSQVSTLPDRIFSLQSISDPTGLLLLIGAGFLVGFGTRYAGGCTSGHAISGLSNLQLPSLIAVIGFFIGGLIMTHFGIPLLFN